MEQQAKGFHSRHLLDRESVHRLAPENKGGADREILLWRNGRGTNQNSQQNLQGQIVQVSQRKGGWSVLEQTKNLQKSIKRQSVSLAAWHIQSYFWQVSRRE